MKGRRDGTGLGFYERKSLKKKSKTPRYRKSFRNKRDSAGLEFYERKSFKKKKKTRNHAIEKVLRKKRINYANDHAIGPEEKASFVPTFCFLNLIDSVVSCILS